MKLLLCVFLICISAFGYSETNDVLDNLEIVLNEEVIEEVEFVQDEMQEDAAKDDDNEMAAEHRMKFEFAQGYLLLNEEDYGIWDFSHILAVRVRETAENTYSFDATVRHRDEGWDHYADMFRIVAADKDSSVENGERVLLHPHDNEQPFTRSQSQVVATGVVCIEAKDNVHKWGGSSLCLDLTKLDFNDGPISINWQLTE